MILDLGDEYLSKPRFRYLNAHKLENSQRPSSVFLLLTVVNRPAL